MTKNEIQDLIDRNFRVTTLLGMVASMLMFSKAGEDKLEHDKKVEWFLNAVNEVIYNDKPIPPFPLG